MLRPLSLAGFGVILFPSETRLLPALVHSINKILSELGVQFGCACFVWSLLLSEFLQSVLALHFKTTQSDI
jgi:hypothetical protein